jgi:hypothetical protein
MLPKLKIKLKGPHFAYVAKIQEAVTDELKKVPKEETLGSFSEIARPRKRLIYANGANFELKKVMCLPCVSSIFKKFSPKTFGPHCVFIKMLFVRLYSMRLQQPQIIIRPSIQNTVTICKQIITVTFCEAS